MSDSTIRAALGDGPRAGEVITVAAGPDGGPPAQVVVSDPLGAGGRVEESFDIEPAPVAATTYHLHGRGDRDDTYVYRTGHPD